MSKKNIRTVFGLIVRHAVKFHLLGIIAVLSLIVALMVPLFLRPRGHVQLDSGHRLVMGTFARVVAVAADSSIAKKCIEAALVEIENVDELMSDYKSDSEISQVNRDAFKRPVKVGKSTFEVLRRSSEFSKLSAGAFDITIGPLAEFWRLAAEANSVPTDAELEQARSKVGYEKLILDANEMTVRFADDGMKLDLGGIAKGYAIDRAVEAMQRGGAIGGMVDVGGDIRCFGAPPPGKKTWRIGLQDPTATQGRDQAKIVSAGEVLLVLKLTNAAVATSGGYRRFVLIEGRKYSHIMNRDTGASAEGLSSVTVIANNAIDADALATAVSVMGAEKGLALIETIPKTEAILITSPPEYKLIKTSGAGRYVSD